MYNVSLTLCLRDDITVAVSERWYDFDENEAIDIYDFITQMFYCLRKSFEYLYSPRFQSGIESKKIK